MTTGAKITPFIVDFTNLNMHGTSLGRYVLSASNRVNRSAKKKINSQSILIILAPPYKLRWSSK
jgi:hypothetical protein